MHAVSVCSFGRSICADLSELSVLTNNPERVRHALVAEGAVLTAVCLSVCLLGNDWSIFMKLEE